jgi:UDP-3-O-[3-hydroxymyristoyl] glucosamine N-acyltransferase
MYGQAPINYKGKISDDSVIHGSAPIKVDASLQNQVTIFGQAPVNFKGSISDDSVIHTSAPLKVDASLQNQVTILGQAPINFKGKISDESVIHGSALIDVDASLKNLSTMYTKCIFRPHTDECIIPYNILYKGNPSYIDSPQSVYHELVTSSILRETSADLVPVPIPVEDAVAVVGGLIDGLVQAD